MPQLLSRNRSTDRSTPREAAVRAAPPVDSPPLQNVLPLYLSGVHFGILQAALFFVVQVYVTATYMGYFVVVLAWMLGLIVNLRLALPRTLSQSLAASIGAYYVIVLLSAVLAPARGLTGVYFVLAMLVASPAGAFFREFGRVASVRSLFLHENNGFVLGLLLGTVAFVQWGVHFLYLAPLLSLALVLLSRVQGGICVGVLLPALVLIGFRLGGSFLSYTLVAVAMVGAATWLVRPGAVAGTSRKAAPGAGTVDALSTRTIRFILAISGCNLILLQFFITREFSGVLAASELAILVVGIAYFCGFSIGYFLSRRIPDALLRFGACAMFFVHLGILLFAKVAAGLLIQGGFGWSALVGLLFAASFCAASLYSIFLPRLIHTAGVSLASGYTWDLAGAVCGTILMFIAGALAPQILLPAYFVLMLLMLALLLQRSGWAPAMSVVGLATIGLLVWYQPPLRTLASEDYYRTRGYDHPQVVFAGNSFYHSIDVIDTFEDAARTQRRARASFINGVRYFRQYDDDGSHGREASLSEFTYFLAALPAKYLHEKTGRRLRVLIMGGGSMSTISRVEPYSKRTTLVEIDPLVIESAIRCWSDVNRYDQISNYEVVLDDVKHYLRTTTEKFDLIVNDISAPYYLGTTLLHGREFYELVRSRLKSDGLFSESTQSRPYPDRPDATGMKILRGVADVFDHYRVVDCRDEPRGSRGFVYATQGFDLLTDEITAIMKRDEKYHGTGTYWEGSSRYRLHRATPFCLTNMQTLLTTNVRRISRRLNLDEDDPEEAPSLSRVLWRASNPDDPLRSQLVCAVRGKLADPWFLFGCAVVVLVAALPTALAARRRRTDTPAPGGRSGRDQAS